MKVFGWIPHLGPGLEIFSPNPHIMLKDTSKVFCDDTCSSEPMLIEFSMVDDFEYDTTILPLKVSYGAVSLEVDLKLDNRGLLTLSTSDESNIEDDKIRHLLREVYFEVKRRFHKDTHHSSDIRTDKGLRGPDEQCSLSHGTKNETQAIAEIFGNLLKSIHDKNNGLSRLTAMPISSDKIKLEKQELMIHDLYKSASGFISYAMNYVNLFFDNSPVYLNSLKAYQSSLDSLYASHCNEVSNRLNISFLDTTENFKEQNTETAKISKNINTYTVIMHAFTAINVVIAVFQIFIK
ncbi:MAG: hypothetical protein MJZ38_06100 [archaeon]|nr:hypothetical protein [archaeon]